ncbi:type II secretion system F family protein [Bacillus sp. HMF5848]|nr:type II secretion system F family protein [Bacillus sp. HMF5848]
MLYLSLFFTVTLLIYGLFEFRVERRKRVKKRLSYFFKKKDDDTEREFGEEEEAKPSFARRVLRPIWLQLRRTFRRRLSNDKTEKLELKLLQAGNPFGMTPFEFRLVQLGLLVLLPVVFTMYGMLLKWSFGGLALAALVGFAVGGLFPGFYLKQKIKTRNHLALRELPDILDLLTVSLEAGLGFDSAMSKVVSKKDGIIANEFHRCLEEIRLGRTRREALSGIRDRLVLDEMKTLISSIVQAEKLGIGMVTVLRVQSNEVREQRKQRAEEEAMKAPIKMLFPLVLFIFPSLFIVLLGPAVIQFLETFGQ